MSKYCHCKRLKQAPLCKIMQNRTLMCKSLFCKSLCGKANLSYNDNLQPNSGPEHLGATSL